MAEREYYREKEGMSMKEFTECCTVIAEGEIIKESLNRLGRDDRWLRASAAAGDRFAGEVFWGISDGEEVELHMIL